MHPNSHLRDQVRASAENRPGVYRMYGPGDELLYVGKSIRVRTRLLSYFRAAKGEKAGELVRATERIEWEYIPNEFASLIREMKLIQRWQPRFNVQHKRRRMYAFVKITREDAPRVLPVTRIVEDGSVYFGPFPRVAAVARTIRELAHVLGLRDCPARTPVFFADQLEMFDPDRSPRCIRADLGTCLAPCCGKTEVREYLAAAQMARRFLEGRADEPLADLERRMADAAARMDFEYAAILRDRLDRLRYFRDELAAFRGRVEDLTFVYRVPGFEGDDRIYLVRRGRIRKELPNPKTRRARVRAAEVIESVFKEVDHGPMALEPDEAAEILLVARWFRMNPSERRRTVRPSKWLAQAAGPPAKAPRARRARVAP